MTLPEALLAASALLAAWGWHRQRRRSRYLLDINLGLLQMALELQREVYTLAGSLEETT